MNLLRPYYPTMKRILLSVLFCASTFAADTRDAVFQKSIEEMYPKLVEIRRDIHRHPELSNDEERTAKLVADRLKELGFTDIKTGVAKHGVVALLKGAQEGPCVAVRADMDALPIKELRSVPYRSQNPGVMHACGHDVHVACALGVAVPLAEEMAASRAEKLGVFVRTLGLWKRLMRVKRVVFDKTGTLTLENPVLENPAALQALDAEARAALRHLVTGNLHPVSRSLFDAVAFAGDAMPMAGTVKEVVGHGLAFNDADGHEWRLGRPEAASAGDAVLTRDGVVCAAFRFRDELRAESVQEVRQLRERQIEVCVLSGDRARKVADIAHKLELPESCWQAELTPEAKASWLRERNRDDTLYVGDGANDSLAFDAALCAGSPVTGRSFLEQKADFFFLGHSLRFVTGLLTVAQLHRRATRRVFAFSVTYNIATAVAGLTGHLSPLVAAVLMPLSSLCTLTLVAWTFRRSAPVVVKQVQAVARVAAVPVNA